MVVPHLMHPTCGVHSVSDVRKGEFLQDLEVLGRDMCDTLEHRTRTKDGQSDSPPGQPHRESVFQSRPRFHRSRGYLLTSQPEALRRGITLTSSGGRREFVERSSHSLAGLDQIRDQSLIDAQVTFVFAEVP